MATIRSMVVGANGFLGKNLVTQLKNRGQEVIEVTRETKSNDIITGLGITHHIYYVAGVNRPKSDTEYEDHLYDVAYFCKLYKEGNCKANLVYASSTHVFRSGLYASNKRNVESIFQNSIPEDKRRIERFTNVFGKWCKPNYNNFVATFIHNVINDKETNVSDDMISLIHIDDLVNVMIDNVEHKIWKGIVSDVYRMIKNIHLGDRHLNSTFKKQIHSTYCSQLEYLNEIIPSYVDDRGAFIPMYEYSDNTMISVNIVNAGYSKGGHWHHTKIEEFTCIEGHLDLELIDILTNEKRTIPMIPFQKITIPPATFHTVVNKGKSKGIFLIWTNELYNEKKSDTWK